MATEQASQNVEEIKLENDINIKLIYLVKEHPFIFNAQDPKYRDRDLLERTWATIASEIELSIDGK